MSEEIDETGLEDLEAALGYTFVQRRALVRALTHRSLAHELKIKDLASEHPAVIQPGDNERLEFLGDAVLGLVVADALFRQHREWHEGELTRVRSRLVSRQRMAEVADSVGLGQYLRLSRGEDRSGLRSKSTVLSNSMEAVIGAIYLDGGLDEVKSFVRRQVMGEEADQLAEEIRSGAALGNFKSALQERVQADGSGVPVYRVKSESGPDHRKRFVVEVRLVGGDGGPGKALGRGSGGTKKNAEQDAARRALTMMDRAAGLPGAAADDEKEMAG